jgi:hypothetical protein
MLRLGITPTQVLRRHVSGDWSEMDDHDRAVNTRAISTGERILSAFGEGDSKLWVITEADRSVTTILLPEEY